METQQEPLLYVGYDDMWGKVLLVSTPLKKGEIVFELWGSVENGPSVDTVQIGPSQHLFCTIGSLLDHSCDPNVYLSKEDGRIFLRAVRDIEANARIFYDYDSSERKLVKPFSCWCGATICRGLINGFSPYSKKFWE